MTKRTKFIHEGKYVAQLEVELIESKDGWAPYLSPQDAYRLDDIRTLLKAGNIQAAAKIAKIYQLTPATQ